MMNVDTRNGWITIIATITVCSVVVLSIIGIIILAVVHDGQLSAEALNTFTFIALGNGAGGVLLGLFDANARAKTAQAAISAGASIQGSPISVSAAPVTTPIVEPTNDVGGAVSGVGV